jgi:hypothetical protein
MENNAALLAQLEEARKEFLELLKSVPESDYPNPSGNDAWTVGDILFHITLGPGAIALEAWLVLHARGLFQFAMNRFPSRAFNRINAWFGRRATQRLTPSGLAKQYQTGHAALRSVVRRAREQDLANLVVYPPDFVSELAGDVDLKRLVSYAVDHVRLHTAQLKAPQRLE